MLIDDDDDDGFFEVQKRRSKGFCNLTGVTNCIINEQDFAVRTWKKVEYFRRYCIKTKEELEEAIKDTIKGYKEIIFGSDAPACMACLEEFRKQQVIDQKTYDQKLMEDTMRKFAWEGLQENITIDRDTMIDKRTGEVLNPDVDSTYWKDKFETNCYGLYRP